MASAPGTRPALVEAIQDWLADHDPGGVDTSRAVHLAVSFVLIIALGTATASMLGLDPGLQVTFPLMGGAAALVLISFTPAASIRAEARTMARLFLVAVAFLLLLIVVGPGEGPGHEMAQKLILVPLAFIALALRRSGMDGQRLGLALILVAMIGTILGPTRAHAAWFLVAFCEGALVAALVRLSPFRPSAQAAFVDSTLDMQGAVAAFLRQMADAVRSGQPFPEDASATLEKLRARIWNALANATAENPAGRNGFEQLRVKIYRLRVAVELLAGCIPPEGTDGEGWRRPFSTAADFVARRLEALDVTDVSGEERFERALMQLRAVAFSPDLPATARFALLRAVTAFERLALVVSAIAEAERSPPEPAPAAPLPGPPPQPFLTRGADGRASLSNPLKVALQGALAAAITTALDLGLGLDHAYWATMTVMFVMGNSVGETFVRVRYRTLGTLLGVLAGVVLLYYFDGHVWGLAALCIAAQMVVVVTQKERYDIASAAVGLSVVVGLHLIAGLSTAGMFARIYQTAIGAGVALAVAYFVLPVYLTDEVKPTVRALLERCRNAFATWWPHAGGTKGERVSVAPLAREVRQLDERLPQVGAEQMFGHSAMDLANIVATLDVLVTYLALMEDSAQRLAALDLKGEVTAATEAARSRTLTAFAVVLGEVGKEAGAAAEPVLDAAVSTALTMANDPQVAPALPLVADYLAYSQVVLRPLGDLAAALADQAPWRAKAPVAAAGLDTTCVPQVKR